jgi:TolB-like protein/DNA-binding winged helix-turn-helix (wHTH) protein
MPAPPPTSSNERLPLLRFGEFELDRNARELRRQGNKVRLQVQPFRVLAYLLERAGQVVTREELRERLWPSSVFVDFDHGLNNAIARLREALGDTAATPQFIETMPRHGYRFTATVVNDEPAAISPAATVADSTVHRTPGRRGQFVVIGASVILLLGLLLLWFTRGPQAGPVQASGGQKAPSIAVLPFVNMSADPDSEHFADGLTEEILGKLADIRGLKVIGRTSSFYFKGKQDTLPAIARTLNVNHVLEGSVQRSGERLRIAVQLVDATDGSHLWSQTFDRNFTDIFQVQQDIAVAVATALQVQLLDTDEERLHRRGTQDAEAYRLYILANAYLRGITVKADAATARQLYERAITRDPRFAAAYGGLARYYFRRAWTDIDSDADELRLGLAAAERAITLDPQSSVALQERANFAMWQYRFLGDLGAYAQATADYRRAIQQDPSNQGAFFDYGRAMLWHDPQLAQTLFERVAELEPLALPARGMSATALGVRGLRTVARERLRTLDDGVLCCRGRNAIYRAGNLVQFGQLDEGVIATRDAQERGGLELPVWLWSMFMSLGDLKSASATVNFGDAEDARALGAAAELTMRSRYADAYAVLNRYRSRVSQSRLLDLPAARLALIAGMPGQALAILRRRLPDLYSGVEPVNGHNVIPALDLAIAWRTTGEQTPSQQLLKRIAAFLDTPAAPQLPLFIYQRARAHALAGESDLAMKALDRAFTAGFRDIWAPDLHPQPLLYIDSIEADPAFLALRSQARYQSWLARLKSANAHQLARLRAHDAAKPPG